MTRSTSGTTRIQPLCQFYLKVQMGSITRRGRATFSTSVWSFWWISQSLPSLAGLPILVFNCNYMMALWADLASRYRLQAWFAHVLDDLRRIVIQHIKICSLQHHIRSVQIVAWQYAYTYSQQNTGAVTTACIGWSEEHMGNTGLICDDIKDCVLGELGHDALVSIKQPWSKAVTHIPEGIR